MDIKKSVSVRNMPLQRISVKNNETENWIMTSTEPVYTPDSVRLGSTSSNISFSNNDICRICHCEADGQNPLLSPCYCSGSLKYVHQACLQQWLNASETRSCELCKFNFIMHTKIKPFNEWRRLEMSGVERRRLGCAVLFHCIAALCVIWSLFVLIDRATEEVQKGLIAWPFWTKLVVVAVGFTGGAVFMYIQCRQYLHLCNRWKAHNRIILIQNAPEKIVAPPSPTFRISIRTSAAPTIRQTSVRPAQVVANIENNPLNLSKSDTYSQNSNDSAEPSPIALIANAITKHENKQNNLNNSNLDESFVFGERNSTEPSTSQTDGSGFDDTGVYVVQPASSIVRYQEDAQKPEENYFRMETVGPFDPLEINIQEMLALDIEHAMHRSRTAKNSVVSLADSANENKSHFEKNKAVFKSLPNLSSSNEKLLP